MVIIGLLCSEVTLLASRRCICWWLTTILKLLPLTLYLHLSNRGTLTECEKPVFWKNYMTLYRQFYIDNFVQVCYVVLRCLFLTLNKTSALLQLASTSSERKRLKMAFIEVRRKLLERMISFYRDQCDLFTFAYKSMLLNIKFWIIY